MIDWSYNTVPRTLCRCYLSKQPAVLFFSYSFYYSLFFHPCSSLGDFPSLAVPKIKVSFLITLSSAPVGDRVSMCSTKSQWSPASSASRTDHWLRLLSVEEPSSILTFQTALFLSQGKSSAIKIQPALAWQWLSAPSRHDPKPSFAISVYAR